MLNKIFIHESKYVYMLFCFWIFLLAGCSSIQNKDTPKPTTIDKRIQYKKDFYLGQRIYLAKVDPDLVNVLLVRANNGLEKPSSIAKRMHAEVVINAGYFLKEGTPAGAYKEHNNWIQKPKKHRGVMGWTKLSNSFFFDRLKSNEKGHVTSSLQEKTLWWEKTDYLVGGAPLLIYKTEIMNPETESVLDSFLTRRYARTATCMDNNQKLLLVVVEGGDWLSWNLGFRNGLTMQELISYLKTQGCVNALNLDGGKSSTMVVQGKVVNTPPHFSGERPVSDVIAVVVGAK
jgi:exopolysaccharide biosynthesis protein